ncbi:Nucleotide-binding oligomerization domain-containing protein 2 [Takifugu flavidus]|uniref:Nucleotide-binding oligomerization domain-containing protein 2 n=2 Tax=Takifugu flavidus TaxID=433684 RepID=A0A5C6N1B7_9TELE|nr:Nucleotide-binding oligomerization domain-containing protein 2 [Takifugu flavidus]
MSLKRRCEHVTEGTHEAGSGTLLNKIYTELYITEGQSEEVDTQHELSSGSPPDLQQPIRFLLVVDRITEVRGFTDSQKESTSGGVRGRRKYGGKQEEERWADKELLLKLGRLAFEHLEKGNILFYSEDLERCGLDVSSRLFLLNRLDSHLKMSECVMEEEERAESTVSSCVSMKSDWSKDHPLNFGIGPQGSPLKMDEDRAESTVPSWVSLKSDRSKDDTINFRSSEEIERGEHILSNWDQSAPPGESSCSQSGSRSGDAEMKPKQRSDLQEVIEGHKMSLKRRCEHVTEGTHEAGSGTLLNKIYTELYITEGQSEEVDTQHEVRQLERTSKKNIQDTPIKCQDIFKVLSEQQRHIRVVLTNGVAGVGKTFSVQKFSLDWAEGLENQDISLVLPLSCRELNLIRDEQHSLLSLLHVFHPTLQKIRAEDLTVWKLLFIFDGLDESRFSLGFNKHQLISDVTQVSSVDVLLVNLIQGNLLPSALIWITSRPAAAYQIPPSCVDRITEVRGFTDSQKEEYFRRRFSDEDLSKRIISHIKASRSLHIMCLIPVFCWITAIVLEDMMTRDQRGELPKTLTDLYSHFLRFR